MSVMRWLAVASVFGAGVVPSTLGCTGAEVETIDCATTEVKAYSQIGDALAYCTSCHGAGNGRGGVSLGNYDDAVSVADESMQTIADGSMPPGGSMPDAARLELFAWAQCGTPE